MGKRSFTGELKPLEFLLLMFLEISDVFVVVVVVAIVGMLYYITWLLQKVWLKKS